MNASITATELKSALAGGDPPLVIDVPPKEVLGAAKAREAIPYDVSDAPFSHDGERCSFDAFLKTYRLGGDPALARLAEIVRGADTARLDLAPQAAGLLAISLGLSRNFEDDHEMLNHGMVMYDALYAWCKEGQDESHTWKPGAQPRAASHCTEGGRRKRFPATAGSPAASREPPVTVSRR